MRLWGLKWKRFRARFNTQFNKSVWTTHFHLAHVKWFKAPPLFEEEYILLQGELISIGGMYW